MGAPGCRIVNQSLTRILEKRKCLTLKKKNLTSAVLRRTVRLERIAVVEVLRVEMNAAARAKGVAVIAAETEVETAAGILAAAQAGGVQATGAWKVLRRSTSTS
jgi:hypothetical protein